ncbi:MAG: peptidoglycan DD-metalloendopeptidase family protein [Pseudomonadota bacterium]|nr:peptidoglycan DD-metalloendopeptidase family protein [Pseudomonadota bacterium]
MRLLIVWLLLNLGLIGSLSASEEADVENELSALRETLKNIETTWRASRTALTETELALSKADAAVSRQVTELRRTQQREAETQTQIDLLLGHKNELIRQRDDELLQVKQHIRAAARMGATSPLKVMLNQEDPNSVARVARYFGYFAEARLESTRALEATLADLADSEVQLQDETEALAEQRELARVQRDELQEKRSDARAIVARYTAEFDSIDTRLNQLRANEQDLIDLLESLRASIFDIGQPNEVVPFASRKGQLALPLEGPLIKRFGELRPEGRVKWTGVLIEAELGTPVKAIHYGRVVFADWLRGFGLLMIISHDNGYMSLYGHNQVLLVEPGEWVNPGQIIGETGTSGGQPLPTTYFEIRAAGQPIDPMLWCAVNRPTRKKS